MRLEQLLVAEPPGAGVIGVEREYRVVQDGRAVDFRELLPHLRLEGGGLDPADPRAHHLPCGILLTADGEEAEVATPPVPLAPGAIAAASAWVEHGEDLLVAALPGGTGIEGYSTHLNVAVRGDVVAIAARFASRFALPMMLLLDRHDSPGLLVRPRPGRLELGGDFVAGSQLRAALAFAIAAARCCERDSDLPPAPRAKVRTVLDRPGWFVPRDAFGPDLYELGRAAVVRVGRQDLAAGEHVAAIWTAMRAASLDVTTATERDELDAEVDGRRPIPLEALSPADASTTNDVTLCSPFARLQARHRPGLSVTVAAMSWAAVAFEVVTPARTCHVLVPRRWLDSFLRCVDDGTITTALDPDDGHGSSPHSGPRVITGPLRADAVVPPEPHARTPWWRHRQAELLGIAAGAAATLAAIAASRW